MRTTKEEDRRSKRLAGRSRAVAATVVLGAFLLSTLLGSLLFGGLAVSSSVGRALTPMSGGSGVDDPDALALAEQSLQGGASPSFPLPAYLPTTRADVIMTYDAKDAYIVLFGGVNKSGTLLSDTSKFGKDSARWPD